VRCRSRSSQNELGFEDRLRADAGREALALEIGDFLIGRAFRHDDLVEDGFRITEVGGENLEEVRLGDLRERELRRTGAGCRRIDAPGQEGFGDFDLIGELDELDVDTGRRKEPHLLRYKER